MIKTLPREWDKPKSLYGKSGHPSTYYYLAAEALTLLSSFTNSLSRDTDGRPNTKSLKAVTSSGQVGLAGAQVSTLSVSGFP